MSRTTHVCTGRVSEGSWFLGLQAELESVAQHDRHQTSGMAAMVCQSRMATKVHQSRIPVNSPATGKET